MSLSETCSKLDDLCMPAIFDVFSITLSILLMTGELKFSIYLAGLMKYGATLWKYMFVHVECIGKRLWKAETDDGIQRIEASLCLRLFWYMCVTGMNGSRQY